MDLNCHDCGVPFGSLHEHGCDVERCPRCGGQYISCDCIYEVCGININDLEESYPEIYENGPTDEMYKKWDNEWFSRRIPWTGENPGLAECREFGWYSKFVKGQGWIQCEKDDPEASEDLNRLYVNAKWNPDMQKFEQK